MLPLDRRSIIIEARRPAQRLLERQKRGKPLSLRSNSYLHSFFMN
jgi:hypothetical protein